MTPTERRHVVRLHGRKVGTLRQKGDYTRFSLDSAYLADPDRLVIGLAFEQNLNARQAATLRLPQWFSNLLPEGRLRAWIAVDRGVSPSREMELLAQVGHDLPGAVSISENGDEGDDETDWPLQPSLYRSESEVGGPWRFSLAGVALKFSMLAEGDRLTMPAYGAGGDWIVKLPDRSHKNVPLNEFTMMSFADAVGIEVPEVRLVHRDEIDGLPRDVWPSGEEWAYAVRRFDRDKSRQLIHIEDLAQVRGVYPEQKYNGNYETVAALIYRRQDVRALLEFSRRLAFNVLISNGDAHLKNWSLIYTDPRVPTLSPAYDLVSTRTYMGRDETLGMNFAGSRRFDAVRLSTFERLERRLGCNVGLADAAREIVSRVSVEWPRFADMLEGSPNIRADIADSIRARTSSLRRVGRPGRRP